MSELPLRDASGQTWAQWVEEFFEYETCLQCGGDADDHDAWIVVGYWFAHCRTEPE